MGLIFAQKGLDGIGIYCRIMEAGAWNNFDDDLPCLARDSCIDAVLRDSPADSVYRQLGELDLGDDD